MQLSADIYHAAAQPLDAIYDVRGDRVVPVVSAGRLFTFPTAATSRFGAGAMCETSGRPLFVLTHVGIEPFGWKWYRHVFRWRGPRLIPGEWRSGQLPVLSIADPRVARFYELICGRLRISQVTDSYPPPP